MGTWTRSCHADRLRHVLHANQTMRLEPVGTLPEQVDRLLLEMGIALRSDNISLPGAPAGLGALSSASPQPSPHGESAQPNRNSRRTYQGQQQQQQQQPPRGGKGGGSGERGSIRLTQGELMAMMPHRRAMQQAAAAVALSQPAPPRPTRAEPRMLWNPDSDPVVPPRQQKSVLPKEQQQQQQQQQPLKPPPPPPPPKLQQQPPPPKQQQPPPPKQQQQQQQPVRGVPTAATRIVPTAATRARQAQLTREQQYRQELSASQRQEQLREQHNQEERRQPQPQQPAVPPRPTPSHQMSRQEPPQAHQPQLPPQQHLQPPPPPPPPQQQQPSTAAAAAESKAATLQSGTAGKTAAVTAPMEQQQQQQSPARPAMPYPVAAAGPGPTHPVPCTAARGHVSSRATDGSHVGGYVYSRATDGSAVGGSCTLPSCWQSCQYLGEAEQRGARQRRGVRRGPPVACEWTVCPEYTEWRRSWSCRWGGHRHCWRRWWWHGRRRRWCLWRRPSLARVA